MFGITTFAQSTFAGLSIVDYVDSVTNTISLTDMQVGGFQYVVSQTNTQTLTDTNISQVAFLSETSDLFVITTVDSVLAQFNVVNIDSLVTLSDFQYARGWFNINDNQTVTWGAINNTQAPTWSSIDDTQNPNWINIDDNQ